MELVDFIIEAKIAGYASGDSAQETSFGDDAKGFIFEANDYRYIDKYYGFNPFSGSELVFDSSGKLLWAMNYYGSVKSICDEPNAIYQILREAMLKIDREYPFRGPSQLLKNEFKYENIQSGSLKRFQGEERILKNDVELYLMNYHGGSMV